MFCSMWYEHPFFTIKEGTSKRCRQAEMPAKKTRQIGAIGRVTQRSCYCSIRQTVAFTKSFTVIRGAAFVLVFLMHNCFLLYIHLAFGVLKLSVWAVCGSKRGFSVASTIFDFWLMHLLLKNLHTRSLCSAYKSAIIQPPFSPHCDTDLEFIGPSAAPRLPHSSSGDLKLRARIDYLQANLRGPCWLSSFLFPLPRFKFSVSE